MSNTAISIQKISKRYFLGSNSSSPRYSTLRDSLGNAFSSIWLGKPSFSSSADISTQENSKEFWALDSVSIDLNHGDRLGIVGRNGAGKSTLLKILGRITDPTSGRVEINGRIASLLEVGTGFHPELTGRENIFLNGTILGMTRAQIKNKFDQIVDFSEIEEFLDTPVKRYSSGMYVKLAFSVAAHLDSDILLVDEVLAVGDSSFQKKCMSKMDELSNASRTIVFVSHQSEKIKKLCNKVLWLEKGKLVEYGSAEEVVDRYEKKNLAGHLQSDGIFLRKKSSDYPYISKCTLNLSDKTSVLYKYGDSMRIDVDISPDNQSLSGMYLIWSIYNEFGQLITSGNTSSAGFDMRNSSLSVTCKLPYLPFCKGKYNIELGLGINGVTRTDTWSDEIYFEIYSSDPYENGSSFTSNAGSVFVPHEWNQLKIISGETNEQ